MHAFKDYFPPTRGGVEIHINDIVHNLHGFNFKVLTSSGSRQSVVDDDRGVEVMRTPEYFRPVSTPITPAWIRALKKSEADVMHFHSPNPFGELALLASGVQTPLVVTFHAEIIGRRLVLPFFTPFQQAFLARAGHIVVSSPNLLATSSFLRGHRERAVVIPFGIEPERWMTRPAAADEIRERHGGTIVLFLGRLAYYKGLSVLLEAMRSVDAKCLLVGAGPKKQELEKQAEDPELRSKIAFCGEVPDDQRAAYLHAADIFVLPSTSRAECFGIAMLEAMATGTPVISTELGTGTSWVNKDGVTGKVVAPSRPAALAEAINDLLDDPVRRAEMGAAAQERAISHFTRRAMLAALDSVYRSA